MNSEDEQNIDRKLAIAIMSFLEKKSRDSTVTDEQAESLIVAKQCIESAFNIVESTQDLSFAEADNLYRVFSQSLRDNIPRDTEKAIQFKNEGNELMRVHQYSEALEKYTQAINFDSTNPVYYCNRAASYLNLGRAEDCIVDCRKALSIDPTYGKAHGRMGAAYLYMNKPEIAEKSLLTSLQYDPDNQNTIGNLRRAQSMRNASAQNATSNEPPTGQPETSTPSTSSATGAFDFGSILQSPQLVDLASQMMSNPQVQNMISGVLGSMTSTSSGTPGVAAASTSTADSGGLNIEALLRAGQQMASSISSTNADLLESIRQSMNRQANPSPPQPEDEHSSS